MKGNKETESMCRKGMKATGKAVKRKIVMLMMAVMLIIVSFAGCGNKKEETGRAVNDETKTISESEQQNPENETEEVSDDVFADIFDDIELNGKKVTFPFSLNELGDEYTIDDEPFAVNKDENMMAYHLYYNGEKIADIDYKSTDKRDINRDTKMIRYATHKIYEDRGMLKIRGIGINDSMDEITKSCPEFKKLKESEQNGNTLGGYYLANKNNVIQIATLDGVVNEITMRSER